MPLGNDAVSVPPVLAVCSIPVQVSLPAVAQEPLEVVVSFFSLSVLGKDQVELQVSWVSLEHPVMQPPLLRVAVLAV